MIYLYILKNVTYNPSFKPVLFGMGIVLVLFVLPFFLLKVALLLVFGVAFRLGRRLFGGRMVRPQGFGSRRALWGVSWHPIWTNTIRAMSDDEYQSCRQTLRPEQPGVARTTVAIQ
ncbi:MAG: hypothetical protein WA960_00530 [Tunicatimonas sp.]